MEDKISLGALATTLAQTSGKSKKLCEDFLREFFKVVSENLEADESLRIKGLGSFKIVEVESRVGVNINTGEKQEIPAYKKVVFTPAKELAGAINAPFEAFESQEIEDEMPEDIFYEEEEKEEEISDENRVEEPILEAGSDEEAEDDDITYEAYNYEEKTLPEKEEEMIPDTEEKITPAPFESSVSLPVYEDEPEAKSRFGIGFLSGALSMFAVCAVIFMLGCFFNWWPVNFGNSKPLIENEQSIDEDNIVAESQPMEEEIPEPVYDTVSTTRFLTTIAREHYGDFNFWPYIYLENQDILGHPDRITPGTKVVVPELSKYGVDTSNKEDVAKAKKLSQEIYARFK